MGNPLLVFWQRIFAPHDLVTVRRPPRRAPPPEVPVPQLSASIFLVLRRMRAPLIVLIVIFAVSVLGMTLVPGQDPSGRPSRMNFFEAFYFMSSTATTIGFGEVPHSFTEEQRLWVTVTIYLAVIGWAYAIGSLLTLLQDRGFRDALALQHFTRKVAHLHEPFLLIVGYGNAGEMLGRSLDAIGRRFVVLDLDEVRVASLDLEQYHADVPALVGDARDTGKLAAAGLGHRRCQGVLALTGDDEANLSVTMAAGLLRPGLPVIARTVSRPIGARMEGFGDPEVVNPFDRFGDHLRILLRSPASYQLMLWLTSARGATLPARQPPVDRGSWVVCGYGRFGREIAADLRAEGLDVVVVDNPEAWLEEPSEVSRAVGFVAATDSDTRNLSLVAAAREANPEAFLVARQNLATNAALFRAVGVDFVLVAAEVIAHETVARLANPLLMPFLRRVPRQGDAWSDEVVARLVARCGGRLPVMWSLRLTSDEAPALGAWLSTGEARLGDLLRSPRGREEPLDVVPLLLLREGEATMAPDDEVVLAPGDELLLAGRVGARRAMEATLLDPATTQYVTTGQFVPSSWAWRKITRRTPV